MNRGKVGELDVKSTEHWKNVDEQYWIDCGVPVRPRVIDYHSPDYVYQYKDHLGNIRLSYQKNEANSLDIFEDYQSNTGDWVVYTGASVALVNSKLAYSSTPRWKSINKTETVTPGVPIHIEFDFEKGSMLKPVFAVREKINGVWEANAA